MNILNKIINYFKNKKLEKIKSEELYRKLLTGETFLGSEEMRISINDLYKNSQGKY